VAVPDTVTQAVVEEGSLMSNADLHDEKVVLTINRSESICGACGRTCLPHEERHETVCGWDRHAGCGATYTHVTTHYFGVGVEESARRMRPDLIWLDTFPQTFPPGGESDD
jgi:hypothetical protein